MDINVDWHLKGGKISQEVVGPGDGFNPYLIW